MRLADFILRDMEQIVSQWEDFARSLLPAAREMTRLALRDHAKEILEAIAKDLGTKQTKAQQDLKSKGRAPVQIDAKETAAQTHAILRARSGFNINQLAAEYRALRASVLRLWSDACDGKALDMGDMIRFNEAIDEALAESMGHFAAQVERSRNLLLGMLGHDMRSPLQTIQMTASRLTSLRLGEEVSEAAHRLIRSGARIDALLDDLVSFNRTNLGLGIPVVPQPVDLATVFKGELDELRVTFSDRELDLDVQGDTKGEWDSTRLQQVLANLVINAVKYGAPSSDVKVLIDGKDRENVRFAVVNTGTPISSASLDSIFEPLTRSADADIQGLEEGSLGLGLYIVREITKAHGGKVEVQSNEKATSFAVILPRNRRALEARGLQ